MTPEERERHERIERHIEAVVRNHELFSADLAVMKVIVDRHTGQIERNSIQIAEQAARADQRFAEAASELRQVGAYLTKLARIVQQTIERLDAVILVVERHFSNGRA